MIKHAFLIMAYKDYWMLNQIIQSLDDERNDIYIHIDAKSKDFTKDALNPTKYSKVFFTERIEVSWGGDSKVKCIILLLNHAYNKGKYRYYHLMTESDYVIKNQDYFHNFFIEHDGKEFINFFEPSRPNPKNFDLFHFFENDLGRNSQYPELFPVEQNILKMQVQNNTHRSNKKWTYYKSEGVFSLTSDFVSYILKNLDLVANYFFNGCVNDEHFIVTILMNSEFKNNIYSEKIRLIDWTHKVESSHPVTFTCADHDLIINSECLFARKFNSYVDYKIIKLINQNIHYIEPPEVMNIFTATQDITEAIQKSDYTVCILQYCIGKTIHECPITIVADNYYLINRDEENSTGERYINDECQAVFSVGKYQCSSIRIKDIYYSMQPIEGYHFFFVNNGVVDGCIIDMYNKICNPLIKKSKQKEMIPVLIDEDLEMLGSSNYWQKYKAIKMLLSRPNVTVNFDSVMDDLLNEDSPYSWAAIASLCVDKRYHFYNPLKACEFLKKAIKSSEIWKTEQWTLELFDALQLVKTKDSYEESIKILEPLIHSNNGYAMGRLARCYRDGRGVDIDLNKAEQWMKNAADKGVAWANNELKQIQIIKLEADTHK